MSNEVTVAVLSRTVGNHPLKSVLWCMADVANHDGSDIWLSNQSIADRIEVSRQTVNAKIRELEKMGIVVSTGSRPCDSGKTIIYRIDLDALKTLPLRPDLARKLALKQGVNEDDTLNQGVNLTAQGVNEDDTNRPEPSFNNTYTTGASKTDLPERLYDIWNEVADTHGLSRVKTSLPNFERKKSVLRRLAECGGQEVYLFEAIGNLTRNPFWIGKGEKPWRADFDWVFKSSSNFRKVLEYTPANTELKNAKRNPNYPDAKTRAEQRSATFDAACELALRQA